MYRTDDPIADYDRYDAECEKWLNTLPQCDICGERIQDDYYYKIGTEVVCEECLKDNFRYSNEF